MELIVTAPVGMRGTAELAAQNRERLRQRYSAFYLERAAALEIEGMRTMPDLPGGVRAAAEILEGGIEAALWRLAEQTGAGLRVELQKIPIRQETIEVCNHLDADPYRLFSGGSYLIFTENAYFVLKEIQTQGCPEAACIGAATADKKRILYYSGVERYLTPPQRFREQKHSALQS
ncbi:MAG: hypothetical protein IJ600_04365 [Lachnospiraceae bacterium]|nr:hypothetical protein [Lachnospiraceae bacterium]